jgi:hypothetical protein
METTMKEEKQELTEERIREIAREEIWLMLEKIRVKRLEEHDGYYKFAKEMNLLLPP